MRLYDLVTHKRFDYVMFIFIFLSCAQMMYEHPTINHESLDYKIVHDMDIALTVVFAVEALAKIIAFGFRPYIRSNPNKVSISVNASTLI